MTLQSWRRVPHRTWFPIDKHPHARILGHVHLLSGPAIGVIMQQDFQLRELAFEQACFQLLLVVRVLDYRTGMRLNFERDLVRLAWESAARFGFAPFGIPCQRPSSYPLF